MDLLFQETQLWTHLIVVGRNLRLQATIWNMDSLGDMRLNWKLFETSTRMGLKQQRHTEDVTLAEAFYSRMCMAMLLAALRLSFVSVDKCKTV